MTRVCAIKTKFISYGPTESIKAWSRKVRWGKRGIVYEHDPRHVHVLLKGLGLEQGNSVQTLATHDVTDEELEPLDQVQRSSCRSQGARCSVPESRSSRFHIHRERVVSKDVKFLTTECVGWIVRNLKRERQMGVKWQKK